MARQKRQTSGTSASHYRSPDAALAVRQAIEPALSEISPSQAIDDAESAARFLQRLMRTGVLNGHELSAQTLADMFHVHRHERCSPSAKRG